ncbi:MAG: NYN domain-containing protein [Coriobacteriia bacterium]|nr:NYN domain-containing protein [Coriobacteriia bacterium]MCL2537836.1 NYN domain-containing protein [Coriobacteriia bacterium]
MKARKRLIVDGYNLIFLAEPYRSLARDDEWDLARDALISDIASYAGKDFDATVVFDGKSNPVASRKEHKTLGLTVIFSDYGTSGDAVVERLAKQAVADGVQVEVVSSDALVQWTSLGTGVVRRSSKEFAQQLQHGYRIWEETRDAPPKRSTLMSRISPEAAEMLRRIRDGDD